LRRQRSGQAHFLPSRWARNERLLGARYQAYRELYGAAEGAAHLHRCIGPAGRHPLSPPRNDGSVKVVARPRNHLYRNPSQLRIDALCSGESVRMLAISPTRLNSEPAFARVHSTRPIRPGALGIGEPECRVATFSRYICPRFGCKPHGDRQGAVSRHSGRFCALPDHSAAAEPSRQLRQAGQPGSSN
jgi:hypothetical protein